MFVLFGFEIRCWSSMVILITILYCMLRDILFRQLWMIRYSTNFRTWLIVTRGEIQDFHVT